MRKAVVVAAAILALVSFAAHAAEPYEGVWAHNDKECRDTDGDNSRTYIDMTNREKGKLSPLFDQYEHHCKIDRSKRRRLARSSACAASNSGTTTGPAGRRRGRFRPLNRSTGTG